jgi:regulatory protein
MGLTKTISLIKKANQQNKTVIEFTDGESILLNLDIVLKYSLKKGEKLSEERYQTIIDDNSILEIKKVAFNFASRRVRSKKQILDYLQQKNYTPEEIDASIDFLNEYKLIDDFKFAKIAIQFYANRKNYGKHRIEQELLKKGIEQEIIDKVLNSAIENDEDEEKIAQRLIDKKKKNILSKKPTNRYSYAYNLLKTRGISSIIIRKTLGKFDFKADQLENTADFE